MAKHSGSNVTTMFPPQLMHIVLTICAVCMRPDLYTRLDLRCMMYRYHEFVTCDIFYIKPYRKGLDQRNENKCKCKGAMVNIWNNILRKPKFNFLLLL